MESLPPGAGIPAVAALLAAITRVPRGEGYETPPWTARPGDALCRVQDEHGPLPPRFVLGVAGALFADLDEAERPRARRAFFRRMERLYAGNGAPLPEWLRMGLAEEP